MDGIYNEVCGLLEAIGYDIGDSDGVLISFAVKRAWDYICNFCNIAAVPEQLSSLAAEMALGEFLSAKLAAGELELSGLDLSSAVKAITEGDTKVEFAESAEGTSQAELFEAYIDRLLNRDGELAAFRRFKW